MNTRATDVGLLPYVLVLYSWERDILDSIFVLTTSDSVCALQVHVLFREALLQNCELVL